MNDNSIVKDILSRRGFLCFSKSVSIAILGSYLSMQTTKANKDNTNMFKKGIKCGFLPITDHLLIIINTLFSHPQYSFVPIKFSQWADLAEALRAKAIDMAFVLAPIGMELAAQNVPIKLLLNSHTNGSSLNIRIDSNITHITQIKNKKIAVPSRFSSQYFLLDRILHSNELNLHQIQTIDMSPPEMQAALYNRTIDAFIVAEPFGVIANKRNISKTLLYSKDIYPNHTCCNLVIHQNILEDSIILELARSIQQAREILTKDLPQAIKLQSQIMGQNPQAIQKVVDNNLISYKDLLPSKQALEEFKEFLIREKLSKNIHRLNIESYIFDMQPYLSDTS
ncbi:ABC transporter substrate-binding protein [Helicobacter muridarum]|uniref:ABC transporter substrate-binding protein n=1 Tax=Helicobacter muridarum TaxID=216 RepID=A0A377PV54_9HELI|nr:ABC transporter substrate-binding protein [Helicobacter muridarum]TLD99262.1 ABC transporter substrate-binding protein [Helicobacter muridarum]STQ86151.1 alkanesulfonate transporter substrate-binding subunit [Helicobacter muridarum]